MKLSKRLDSIKQLCEKYLSGKYCFVDMCCDHGHLGLSLAEQYKDLEFHFVDPVESIIENLKRNHEGKKNLFFLCKEGQRYQNISEKIVISICGVGGDLIMDIMKGLHQNGISEKTVFILSPHNRPVELRQFLMKNNFCAEQEILIEDNKKFYEMLVVSKDFSSKLDEIGTRQFVLQDNRHIYYLQKKREHYNYKTRKYPEYKQIVEKYDVLLKRNQGSHV